MEFHGTKKILEYGMPKWWIFFELHGTIKSNFLPNSFFKKKLKIYKLVNITRGLILLPIYCLSLLFSEVQFKFKSPFKDNNMTISDRAQ